MPDSGCRDAPARTRPGSPCPDAALEDGFLLDRLGNRFTVLAIGVDAAPVDGAEMAMLITSSPLLAHWFIPGV